MTKTQDMRNFLYKALAPRHKLLDVKPLGVESILAEDREDSQTYHILLLDKKMPLEKYKDILKQLGRQGFKVATIFYQDCRQFFNIHGMKGIRLSDLEKYMLDEITYINYYQPCMPGVPEAIRLATLKDGHNGVHQMPEELACISKGKLQLLPRTDHLAYLMPEGKSFE